MTLSEFSAAAQASPKWVLNASATLKRDLAYTENEAQRLGLARLIQSTTGMPLPQAYQKAVDALSEPQPDWKVVVAESPDGSVRVEIDLARYLTSFGAALSRVRNLGVPPRGRPRRTRSTVSAVEAAREYGIDLSLLRENLRLTPEQRLRRLDENLEFVEAMRRGLGR